MKSLGLEASQFYEMSHSTEKSSVHCALQEKEVAAGRAAETFQSGRYFDQCGPSILVLFVGVELIGVRLEIARVLYSTGTVLEQR